MNLLLVLARLLALLNLLPRAETGCPRKCECIWRSSKITVDCSGQDLASVPTDVESQTQVLNISANHIPVLSARQFSAIGLTNLQRISASSCDLQQIDGHAFHGLTNLVELDLSSNALREIPSATLNADVPSLMTLSLKLNSIPRIPAGSFQKLAYLQRLDLSHNKIESVEPGAFDGLDQLQRIYLHSNLITNLEAVLLPPSLHGITLHENRWRCDCHLRRFRLWLTQSNVPRQVEPICHGPQRLTGIRISALSLAEFACAPQLSPTSMYLTVQKGKNVSIVCRVSSDPISNVFWFFNGVQINATHHESHGPSSSWQDHSASPIVLAPPMSDNLARIVRRDEVSAGEVRSELLIRDTKIQDNGTYHCQADNKADRAVSNITLHVLTGRDEPKILHLRLEYFVAVAVGIILILTVFLIVMSILVIKVCKQRLSKGQKVHSSTPDHSDLGSSDLKKIKRMPSGSANTLPAKMPKHIRMGTGFMSASTSGSDRGGPDILTDHSIGSSSKFTSCTGTISTNSDASSRVTADSNGGGSYKLAMENIIDDYKQSGRDHSPLIGAAVADKSGCVDLARRRSNRLLASALKRSSCGGALPCFTTNDYLNHSLNSTYCNDLGIPVVPNPHVTLPRSFQVTSPPYGTTHTDQLLALSHLNAHQLASLQQQQNYLAAAVASASAYNSLGRRRVQMMPDEQYPPHPLGTFNPYQSPSGSHLYASLQPKMSPEIPVQMQYSHQSMPDSSHQPPDPVQEPQSLSTPPRHHSPSQAEARPQEEMNEAATEALNLTSVNTEVAAEAVAEARRSPYENERELILDPPSLMTSTRGRRRRPSSGGLSFTSALAPLAELEDEKSTKTSSSNSSPSPPPLTQIDVEPNQRVQSTEAVTSAASTDLASAVEDMSEADLIQLDDGVSDEKSTKSSQIYDELDQAFNSLDAEIQVLDQFHSH